MKQFNRVPVEIYDLGGGPKIRAIWKNYFALVHGIIYVVDSSAENRLPEVRENLEEVMKHDRISKKPLLVYVYIFLLNNPAYFLFNTTTRETCLVVIFLCLYDPQKSSLTDVCRFPSSPPLRLRLINKQDVEGAMEEVDMSKQLNLSILANTYQCPTRIVSICVAVPHCHPPYCSQQHS